ncbi:MAG TPA: HepT-like ribonuclease domain-containing protein [Burkholderiales bacterium]|nr:HepT-like ribonuclease domain-containing protein [Burkholderiales bacterium]
MQPEDRDPAHLWDMLQAARDAAGIVADVTRENFLGDRMRMLALERSLELVGEAARRVSDSLRKKHPGIPWKEMIGLRNILAHDYGRIDHDKLFTTAEKEIPKLIRQLEGLQTDKPGP